MPNWKDAVKSAAGQYVGENLKRPLQTGFQGEDISALHKDARKSLDANILPGEQVIAVVKGWMEHSMVATDRRVFVFRKKALGGFTMTSYSLEQIAGVHVETGATMGMLLLQVPGEAQGMRGGKVDPDKAPNAIKLGRQHFAGAEQFAAALRAQLAQPQTSDRGQPDPAAQLRTLSELLSAGAITQDEFNEKKAVLLDKIQ